MGAPLPSYLPRFPHIPAGFRKGRSVQEGYQRGWGLEFGELAARVAEDLDYRAALSAAEGRTMVAPPRLMNLFLILKFFAPALPPGHIVEYGSYRGGSALFMATIAARLLPGTRVLALDTYAGMPATDAAIDAHRPGDFADAGLDALRERGRALGLVNVDFIKGAFADTAPGTLRAAGAVRLAHIDCDIHDSVACAYDATVPFMVPGGYLVFDDSTTSSCLGATEVVEEIVVRRDGLLSEQIYPHHVFRAP
jgi:predicted O-methyltransferase YrrM